MLANTPLQKKLQTNLLTLLYQTKSYHIGSCLSCLDILIQTLIFEMKKKDKFILSKGHAVPSLYIVLQHLGKIKEEDLKTFMQDGTSLPAHPPPNLDPIIPFPAGSLGHGLSVSCGIAEAMKYTADNKKNVPRIFCLISDGECNEGQVWEAAQYASQRKLSNLICMIDKNGIQAFGKITDVLGDSATVEKWKAFGFDVLTCDGHDLLEIKKTFKRIKKRKNDKPKIIIFQTVKGKGVSFMEHTIAWHYNKMTEEQYDKAIQEINTV